MSTTTNIVVPRDEVLDPFLLPPPVWVDDESVKACESEKCGATFTTLRRKHHCRQCGHIFCQDCSSRRLALPQLGELKPVRVCNGCFKIAYLVGYVISDGQNMQIHGARGLAEIVDQGKEEEKSNLISQGGLDALIYLCQPQHLPELHFWATTALAKFVLIEDHIPTLFMKGALPYLYVLIFLYAQRASAKQSDEQFVSSAKLLEQAESLMQRMLMDKAFDAILILAGFELAPKKIVSVEDSDISYDEICLRVEEAQVLAAKTISSLASNPTNQLQMIEGSDNGLTGLIQLLHTKQPEVGRYVAKSIAYLSTRNDKYKSMLVQDGRAELLASIIKITDEKLAVANQMTIAHTACALANLATNGESQRLLIEQPNILLNLCNVVATFISNKEVQRYVHLTTSMHLMSFIKLASVLTVENDYKHLRRHIARLLANFALYDDNKKRMLGDIVNTEDTSHVSVVAALIAIGDSPVADTEIHRHIVRAFDNLSTAVDIPIKSLAKLIPSISLINRIATTAVDEDIRRRAAQVIKKLDQIEKLREESDEGPNDLHFH
ncbi:8553_t:CDS:10 [Paraglomus brasilianum]|uniref:8553_t:CDS:1 n=1 Tax=Paraglomus brasilianum TaxID=144538 RepID=A0A9N9AXR7_9GLOM|nr:8553_t:CDS:10 [Paraglomus brasilianum]